MAASIRGSNGNSGTGGTTSPSVTVSVTAGDTVAVWVSWEGGATTCSVSNGSSGSDGNGTRFTGVSGDTQGEWHYFINEAGGSTTYTATLGASRSYWNIVAVVINPDGQTVAYDSEAISSEGNGTSINAGTITTTEANAVVLGGAHNYDTAGTWSNQQVDGVAADGDADSGLSTNVWWKVVSSTITDGDLTATYSNSNNWGAASIAFGLTAGGGDTTAPTVSSAAVNAAGTTIAVQMDEAVSIGAGGSGGWTCSLSGVTLTAAVDGGDSTIVTLTPSRTILSGESLTIGYTQPGDGFEDAAGNDLVTLSGQAVTNNSTQTGSAKDPNFVADRTILRFMG